MIHVSAGAKNVSTTFKVLGEITGGKGGEAVSGIEEDKQKGSRMAALQDSGLCPRPLNPLPPPLRVEVAQFVSCQQLMALTAEGGRLYLRGLSRLR